MLARGLVAYTTSDEASSQHGERRLGVRLEMCDICEHACIHSHQPCLCLALSLARRRDFGGQLLCGIRCREVRHIRQRGVSVDLHTCAFARVPHDRPLRLIHSFCTFAILSHD